MKKTLAALIVATCVPGLAMAHTPLFSCYDFGDNTILCEGGFSDGSSAAGVEILVKDGNGAEVVKGKMTEDSEFEFQKPAGDYSVEFNAGPGHSIIIAGKDIVE